MEANTYTLVCIVIASVINLSMTLADDHPSKVHYQHQGTKRNPLEVHNQHKRIKRWVADLCESFDLTVNRSAPDSLFVSIPVNDKCDNVPNNMYPIRFRVYIQARGENENFTRLRSISSCYCHNKKQCTRLYERKLSETKNYLVRIYIDCSGVCSQCSPIQQIITVTPLHQTVTTTVSGRHNSTPVNDTSHLQQEKSPSYTVLAVCLVGLSFIMIVATAVFYKLKGRRKSQSGMVCERTNNSNENRTLLETQSDTETVQRPIENKKILFIEFPPSNDNILLKILKEFETLTVIDILSSNKDLWENYNDWINKTIKSCDAILLLMSPNLYELVQADEKHVNLDSEVNGPFAEVILKLVQTCNNELTVHKYIVTSDDESDYLQRFLDKFKGFDTRVVYRLKDLQEYFSHLNLNDELHPFFLSVFDHITDKCVLTEIIRNYLRNIHTRHCEDFKC